jgi:hypothetical protein
VTAIAYDLPVLNLIAGLDATEHVTHTQHRKVKVTLHHNGARLSHYGVLDVWKVRPASAHFNSDVIGSIAQYVRVAEYAWACGSTVGNRDSISIEMCNQSLGPDWVVGEATWRGAARLAGWLFARVIGERPNQNNLVRHKYWSATECAGPYIDRIYDKILATAQHHYDVFVGATQEDDVDLSDPIKLYNHDTGELKEYPLRDAFYGSHFHAKEADLKLARLETKFDALAGALSDDEAKILTAIRAQPTGGQVDVPALAAHLRAGLGAELASELAERLTD